MAEYSVDGIIAEKYYETYYEKNQGIKKLNLLKDEITKIIEVLKIIESTSDMRKDMGKNISENLISNILEVQKRLIAMDEAHSTCLVLEFIQKNVR